MSEAAFEKMYQRRYAKGHRFLNVEPTVQINNDTYSIRFNLVQTLFIVSQSGTPLQL